MKHLDLVQTYLADINILKVKLLNLHWNVVGKQFMVLHETTEEIYDILWDQIDVVAEVLRMKDELPLSTVKQYLEVTRIEEVEAKEFKADEVLEHMITDLNKMKDLAVEIRNEADEAGDFEVVALFEDYTAEYSKYLWFANSLNK
ncbi:MAG TPA: DNA starvation/stationary phase protection protein [Erysipelotrichaceae bacterium]|nr:DNA starvation/stationary phase protection protein [Erysipelotrichaceae bacterium]